LTRRKGVQLAVSELGTWYQFNGMVPFAVGWKLVEALFEEDISKFM